MVLLLSIPAQAGYLVTLNNGQTLSAETFTIENSRITLKYKVGEVSFPMSMVKSVTDETGHGDFLSGPAPQVVKPAAPQTPPAAAQPPRPWQPPQPPPAQQAVPPAVQPPPQAGLPGVAGPDEEEDLDQEDNNDDNNDLPPDEGEQ